MRDKADTIFENREFYANILNSIVSGVWVSDKDDVIYYANERMGEIAGIPVEKIVGARVLIDFSEDTLKHFSPFYLKAKETLQKVYYEEVPIVTPAGRQSYQSGWLIPRSIDGMFDGMICTVEDITYHKQIENKLRDREQLLREAQEITHLGHFKFDLHSNIVLGSDELFKIFGLNMDEFQFSDFVNSVDPDDRDNVTSSIQSSIEKQESYDIEHYLLLRDGTRKFVKAMGKPILDSSGNTSYIVGTVQDITELKQTEDELLKHRNHLEDLIEERTAELNKELIERRRVEDELSFRSGITEQLNVSVIATGLDFRIIWINNTFSKLYGYSLDEVVGRTPDFLNSDPLSKEIQNDIYQTTSSGGIWTGQALNRKKDGKTFICKTEIFPLKDKKGNIFAYVGHQRDITDHRKLEEERLNEIYLRNVLLDNLPCIAMILKKGTREIVASNEAAKNTGAVPGKTCYGTCGTITEPCYWCGAPELWATGEPVEKEIEYKGNYYKGIWVPFTDDLFVHYIFDITERKKAKDQIVESLKEKEVLLREIHHRVKNNFTVIQSLLELQLKDISDDKSREYFDDAQNRIQSMTMIHEMLQGSDDLKHINTKNYIYKVVDTLLNSYKIDSHAVRLHKDIEDISLDVDTMIPLGLIINELVTNALKYAFPDNVEGMLNISLKKKVDNNYELIIKDTGVGLPEGFDLKKVKSLGLKIVNMLSKQIRGTLEVSSRDGAEFRIVFNEKSIEQSTASAWSR